MMTIAPATLADTDELLRLVNGAYRGASAEAGWAHEAGMVEGNRTTLATLQATIAEGRTAILLLRDDGGVLAGCVSVEQTADPAKYYLGMLTIDPQRQDGGLGRRLLGEGEAFATARGATRMRITVIQLRDTLIAWYERRGYRLTGETEPFPYGDERFGRALRPDLHFVVLEKALPNPN